MEPLEKALPHGSVARLYLLGVLFAALCNVVEPVLLCISAAAQKLFKSAISNQMMSVIQQRVSAFCVFGSYVVGEFLRLSYGESIGSSGMEDVIACYPRAVSEFENVGDEVLSPGVDGGERVGGNHVLLLYHSPLVGDSAFQVVVPANGILILSRLEYLRLGPS